MSSPGKSSFFRQSGWMVMATFTGGIFMAGVQMVASSVMQKADCNTFLALIRLLIPLGAVPSAALATIFAQQAAAAVTEETKAELTSSIRALLRATFIYWLLVAGLGLVFAGPICAALKVNNTNAFRLTMLAALAALWGPTLKGLLQGLHRFTSFGWLTMLEGVFRLAGFVLLVVWIKGGAVGGVLAVFLGQYFVLGTGIWLTRDVWSRKISARFSWKQWSIRGLPLTLGMGSYVFMSSQMDSVFVNSHFADTFHVKLYNDAMLIGFSMTQFIAPITAVMFPTIVRNLALSKKGDPLLLTLAVTGGFALLATIGATLLPTLPVKILFPKAEISAAMFVPCYTWALVPLALANVLIQNLLARGRFRAVPWLVLIPVIYMVTLNALAPAYMGMSDDLHALKAVIATMAAFNLLLFAVAAWFTWRNAANPHISHSGGTDPQSAA